MCMLCSTRFLKSAERRVSPPYIASRVVRVVRTRVIRVICQGHLGYPGHPPGSSGSSAKAIHATWVMCQGHPVHLGHPPRPPMLSGSSPRVIRVVRQYADVDLWLFCGLLDHQGRLLIFDLMLWQTWRPISTPIDCLLAVDPMALQTWISIGYCYYWIFPLRDLLKCIGRKYLSPKTTALKEIIIQWNTVLNNSTMQTVQIAK